MTIQKFLSIDGGGTDTFFLATLNGGGSPALCSVLPGGTVKIVAQHTEPAPGGTVANLATLIGSKGTLADSRWRVDDQTYGIRVTASDQSQAIYVVPASSASAADWTKIYETGTISGNAALTGTKVTGFGLPGFGNVNAAALFNLAVGVGGVTTANDQAIVNAPPGHTHVLLARKGSAAPNATFGTLPGVTFKTLADPISGANGDVAFEGTLTPGDATGIWYAADGAGASLLARTGDPAPGGGHWSSFLSLVLPRDPARGPVFLATLAVNSADGIGKADALGLWAMDSAGNLTLLLRTNRSTLVNGVSKSVKSFTALVPSVGSLGAASGYDNADRIAVLATFTDGTKAQLSLTVP